MRPLTVIIITLNEEENLRRCLESVKRIADEIVVVDSMSADNTVVIAQEFGAKVYQQKFTSYVEQKRVATNYATHQWVLSIDADEAFSPELEQSILHFKQSDTVADAYELSRITNYCGKWIKHCGWYPDRIVRLFDKTKGDWQGGTVHEKWEPANQKLQPGSLKGELLHYSYTSITQHVQKIDKYTEMGARDAVARGKDCSILKVMIVPNWNFFVSYILRLGILDGYYGFIICKLESYSSLVKYAKTREYARLKRAGKSY